jgi:PKD repeat protein
MTWQDIIAKIDVIDANVDILSDPNIEPTSSFSWADLGAGDIQLNDTSTILNPTWITPNAEIAAWMWDYGDGTAFEERFDSNPFTHNYAVSGDYTVRLFIATNYGWQHVSSQVVTATYNIEALFTWQLVNSDPPTVRFTDLSSSALGDVVDRVWDFGDGSGIKYQHRGDPDPVDHEYPFVTSNYTVILTIADDTGATDSYQVVIVVNFDASVIVTQFSTKQIGFSPPVIQLTDRSYSSINPIVSRLWDFGDDSDQVERGLDSGPFTHTYRALDATYQVRLTTTNSAGEFSHHETAVTVVNINAPPVALFEALFQVNGGYRFTDKSTDPEDDIVQWNWDFGDGNFEITTISTNPLHYYGANGVYLVKLTVVDGGGLSHTYSLQVSVTNIPDNGEPVPQFWFEVQVDPKEYKFYDNSIDPNGVITNWHWNWGDGTTNDYGVSTDPTHTYASDGSYLVTLSVTGAGGILYTIAHTVVVNSGVDLSIQPIADFVINSCKLVGTDIKVSFLDTSDLGTDADGNPVQIVSWEWDFGDGTAVAKGPDEQNPKHTYSP